MNDLDARLRDGLAAAADEVEPATTTDLAAALSKKGRRRRAVPSRRPLLVAAAVLAVVAGATAVAVTGNDDPPSERVSTPTPTTAPSATSGAWLPGWHELDTGPVPAASGADVVWADGELLVLTPRALHRWDRDAGWREAATPPIEQATAVWAGDRLVIVERWQGAGMAPVSAWWDPTENVWHDLPAMPDGLPGALGTNPVSIEGLNLVWTGQRVLDLTHGAVLDPTAETWTRLATLGDKSIQGQLGGYLTPVWDGREVILAPFSTEPGAAWNASGTEVRLLPAIPADLLVNPGVREDAVAAAAPDGRVVVVSGTDAGRTLAFDARTDTWSRLPDVPRMVSGEGCPSNIAATGRTVVFQPCAGGPPVRLDGDRWVDLPAPPFATGCCLTRWIDADGALLVWDTDDDIENNPDAPYERAAIWAPGVPSVEGDAPEPSPDPEAHPDAVPSTTLPATSTLRTGAVTAWTGTEYLVWGGQAGGEGTGRADGFALAPDVEMTTRPIPVAPLPPLDRALGAWNGRELVVAGGSVAGGGLHRGAAAYDPSARSWRRLADVPAAVGAVVDVAAVGDDVYAVTDGPALLELGPAGDRWLERAAPRRVSGLASPVDQLVAGDDLLVLWHTGDGGDAPGERYDPATDAWEPLDPVPADQRMDQASAAVVDGWLVAWGSSSVDGSRTAGARLRLDDPTAGWRPVADPPLPPIEWYEGTPGSQSVEGHPDGDAVWFTAVTGNESYREDLDTVAGLMVRYAPARDEWVDGIIPIPGYAPLFEMAPVADGIIVLLPDSARPISYRWN